MSKFTPGPWMWDVNKAYKQVMLTTAHSGRYYVMGFDRWGMQGAAPSFQTYQKYEGPLNERGSLGLQKIDKLILPRMKHHPDFDMYINHPDAFLIAAAPELYDALEEMVEVAKNYDIFIPKFFQKAEAALAKAKGAGEK